MQTFVDFLIREAEGDHPAGTFRYIGTTPVPAARGPNPSDEKWESVPGTIKPGDIGKMERGPSIQGLTRSGRGYSSSQSFVIDGGFRAKIEDMGGLDNFEHIGDESDPYGETPRHSIAYRDM